MNQLSSYPPLGRMQLGTPANEHSSTRNLIARDNVDVACQVLSCLCDRAEVTAGIVWQRRDQEHLVWLASQGISESDIHCDSEYALDILLNVSEAFQLSCPQVFVPCSANVFASTQTTDTDVSMVARDSVVRGLVLNNLQAVLPLYGGSNQLAVALFVSCAVDVTEQAAEELLKMLVRGLMKSLPRFSSVH